MVEMLNNCVKDVTLAVWLDIYKFNKQNTILSKFINYKLYM